MKNLPLIFLLFAWCTGALSMEDESKTRFGRSTSESAPAKKDSVPAKNIKIKIRSNSLPAGRTQDYQPKEIVTLFTEAAEQINAAIGNLEHELEFHDIIRTCVKENQTAYFILATEKLNFFRLKPKEYILSVIETMINPIEGYKSYTAKCYLRSEDTM